MLNNYSILLIFALAVTSVYARKFSYYKEEADSEPCSHFDTVNITDGVVNSDGSIEYDGITYFANHTKTYDYIYTDKLTKVYVESHMRGCICLYKICIKACCNYGEDFVNGTCVADEDDLESDSFSVTIREKNGTLLTRDLFEDLKYAMSFGITCEEKIFPPADINRHWYLRRGDGRIELVDKTSDMTHTQFCLASDESDVYAVTCWRTNQFILSFGVVIAVTLFLTIFATYYYIDEIRKTLHGKHLMCYALTMSVAYILLHFVTYNDELYVQIDAVSEIIYALFVSSFLWIITLNFDIWWSLNTGQTDTKTENSRLLKYGAFSWGIPLLFLLFFLLIDTHDNSDGTEEAFWWMVIVLGICTGLNIVVFIIVTFGIYRPTKELDENLAQLKTTEFSLHSNLLYYMIVAYAVLLRTFFYSPSILQYLTANCILLLHGIMAFKSLVWTPCIKGSKAYNIHGPLNEEKQIGKTNAE